MADPVPGPIGPIPFSKAGKDEQQYAYLIEELISGKSKELFIKASLQALYDLVKRELLIKTKDDVYHAHFRNIFLDRTVSLTSLNIKSIQCAILFTIIDRDLGKEEVPTFVGAHDFLQAVGESWFPHLRHQRIIWDTYETLRPFICGYESFYQPQLKDLCILDDSNLEGTAIITPLNLSLADLNKSLANNIYLIGFTTKSLNVDGRIMSPLEFLMHDLGHKYIRQTSMGTTPKTRNNVKYFLDSAQYRNLSEEQRYICDYWIFLITHETEYVFALPRQEEFFLTDKIGVDKHIEKILGLVYAQDYETKPFLDHFSYRSFFSFYKELLPENLQFKDIEHFGETADNLGHIDEIKSWLLSSWDIFQDEWNKSMDAKDKPDVLNAINFSRFTRRYVPEAIKEANSQIEKNAARWNSGEKGGYRIQRRTRNNKKNRSISYTRRVKSTGSRKLKR